MSEENDGEENNAPKREHDQVMEELPSISDKVPPPVEELGEEGKHERQLYQKNLVTTQEVIRRAQERAAVERKKMKVEARKRLKVLQEQKLREEQEARQRQLQEENRQKQEEEERQR